MAEIWNKYANTAARKHGIPGRQNRPKLYALEIVRRTRSHEKLTLGVSPRGSQMLYRAAQAMAFLDGRGFCVPEDFKPLVVPVFAHRVAIHGMHSSGMKKAVRAEEVIQEIVDTVPVPV